MLIQLEDAVESLVQRVKTLEDENGQLLERLENEKNERVQIQSKVERLLGKVREHLD